MSNTLKKIYILGELEKFGKFQKSNRISNGLGELTNQRWIAFILLKKKKKTQTSKNKTIYIMINHQHK